MSSESIANPGHASARVGWARSLRRRGCWIGNCVALLAILTGSAPIACNLVWGHSPTPCCLLHGEMAKE